MISHSTLTIFFSQDIPNSKYNNNLDYFRLSFSHYNNALCVVLRVLTCALEKSSAQTPMNERRVHD